MAFPQLLPVELPPNAVYSIPIGNNKYRFIAIDSGDKTPPGNITTIYQVPKGKKAILSEVYKIYSQDLVIQPEGIQLTLTNNTVFCYLLPPNTPAYGGTNMIAYTPIELQEGEKIQLVYEGDDLASFLAMSVLIEEKEKNA
jgi:hypothetical protein